MRKRQDIQDQVGELVLEVHQRRFDVRWSDAAHQMLHSSANRHPGRKRGHLDPRCNWGHATRKGSDPRH
eukprot:6929602-Prorocentrum_lima.AAC.1